ncbi:UNVERIFIED_CONTAM: hypothetical protein GTU68_016538 [Idotea baltica]|nr:hypothetical protein [Idotea baltica]
MLLKTTKSLELYQDISC